MCIRDSQWTEPGGSVPLSAASGRTIIQLICARDGKTFTASEPAAVNPAGEPEYA